MKRKLHIVLIAATTIIFGCQRNDEYKTTESKNLLNISIKEISNSSYSTKTHMTAVSSADTLWLNDSIYVEAIADDIVAKQDLATRATPVTNANQITALSIVMFNTKTAQWSASSSQEGNGKSPIKATFSSGSYLINPPYLWVEEDMDYRTLIAMSPYHDSQGFALNTNGQTLDVTVQNNVASQYDLCVSDIDNNKNQQNTIGSNINLQKFEMFHVMTAVGFEAAGYDLSLTGVKLIDVNSQSTLTLHDRTWSTPTTPTTFEAKVNADQWLNSDHIQTSNPWRNITPNDGYMMMLPQIHPDNMKLEFTFTGRNEQSGGTYTMQLNKIIAAGVATSEWKPGMKITYRLRLKTRPSVQNDKLTIAAYKAGSTSSALSIMTSTDDDLTFSWTASWLGMYRGTNTTIGSPESNGYFTPFTTGVNNWTNVKFFARNDHNSIIADRTATITVTGKKSGKRTFTVVQNKKYTGPQPNEYEKIGDIYWAKGNLVASSDNGCKIGESSDCGLYFLLGSLVGWSGGSDGSGVGKGNPNLYQRVWPIEMGTTRPNFNLQSNITTGPNINTLNNYFFNYSVYPWSNDNRYSDIGTFNVAMTGDSGSGDLRSGRYAKLGVGDPCSYYLGSRWRLPKQNEIEALKNRGYSSWTKTSNMNGRRFSSIFLPAAGHRYSSLGGIIWQFDEEGRYGTSSIYSNTSHYYLFINKSMVNSPDYSGRSSANSIRCVSTNP